MESKDSKDFFTSIRQFGFDHLATMSLYGSDDTKEEKKAAETVKHDLTKNIFERKVDCPVCGKQTSIRAVKSSSVRILSKDTDFMTHYQDPNPMFYDAWLCSHCGYAALSGRFKIITDAQKKLIRENISYSWKYHNDYPLLYTADIAIELHQLALLSTVVKQGRNSEKAMICLKLGWLYRMKEDRENELKFLEQACVGFIRAIEKESFPVAGMDLPTLSYLIGELYRRQNDRTNALLWFSRVLTDKNAKSRVKDMARDQKDAIRASETA